MPKLGGSWGRLTLTHPTPIEQVTDAVLTIGNMLDALFSPKSDVRAQHFSGPVGILRAYYSLFDSEQGWRLALAFSVFFNVNLGLFNMLPFPVLDGGHITLALLDAERAAGTLDLIAGSIASMAPVAGAEAIDVRIDVRGNGARGAVQAHRAERVVNCVGPVTSVTDTVDPLLGSLFRSGMAVGDALGLGLRSDAEGRLLDAQGAQAQGDELVLTAG